MLGNESVNVVDSLDEDVAYVQDLDLIFLGSSSDDYKKYSEALRKEYNVLNEQEYNSTRVKMLNTLLNVLPSIYTTSKFKDMFEEVAKSNVSKEIEELQNKSS